MPDFEVPIVYLGQHNYIIRGAKDKADAEEKARDAFNAGTPPDVLGNEWEQIQRIGEIAEVPAEVPE